MYSWKIATTIYGLLRISEHCKEYLHSVLHRIHHYKYNFQSLCHKYLARGRYNHLGILQLKKYFRLDQWMLINFKVMCRYAAKKLSLNKCINSVYLQIIIILNTMDSPKLLNEPLWALQSKGLWLAQRLFIYSNYSISRTKSVPQHT